jgi:hypothetical protein
VGAPPSRGAHRRPGKLAERDGELIAFARHRFDLDLPRKGGRKRDHLESVARQLGRRPAGLDGPQLPAWGEHIWSAWLDLHQGRRVGFNGAEPLSWADLDAWSRLTGAEMRPDEVALLMRVDREFFAVRGEIEGKK